MRKRVLNNQKQNGFLLVELIIVTALAAIISAYGAKQIVAELESGKAEASATYATTLKEAVDEFLNLNALALSTGSGIVGVNNPLAPTIAELKNTTRLPQGFPLIDPFKRRLLISIDSSGCPGMGCTLTAYAYSHLPLTTGCTAYAADGACAAVQGNIKYAVAEEIRQKSHGYGASVSMLNPTRLRGTSCDFPAPPGSGIGTYGICTTRTAAIYSQFVRIRDDRNPDLQGDLSVVGKIKSGSIAVGSGTNETTTISSNGDLTVKTGAGVPTAGISMGDGSGRTYGRVIKPTAVNVKNTNCAPTYQVGDLSQDSSGTGLLMCDGSIWKAISPQKDAVQGGWCPQNGAIAWNTQDVALYCSGNQWVLLADRFGKKVYVDSYSAGHGYWIPKPACTSGTIGASIILVPKNQSTDAVKLNHYAVDNGASWIVSVVDNTGTPAAGEAIAQTYCIY